MFENGSAGRMWTRSTRQKCANKARLIYMRDPPLTRKAIPRRTWRVPSSRLLLHRLRSGGSSGYALWKATFERVVTSIEACESTESFKISALRDPPSFIIVLRIICRIYLYLYSTLTLCCTLQYILRWLYYLYYRPLFHRVPGAGGFLRVHAETIVDDVLSHCKVSSTVRRYSTFTGTTPPPLLVSVLWNLSFRHVYIFVTTKCPPQSWI